MTALWTGTADLHVHTSHSDGAPSVRQLLDHVAMNTTLDVIAIADHDTITGALEAQAIMRQEEYPFEVVVAEEVSTVDGHLVGLFLQEAIPPRLTAAATIAEIHRQGGLAFAPHPFFRCRPTKARPIMMMGLGYAISDLELDAVETINSTPFLGMANRRAARYNATATMLPELGNSDGHILAAIGKGYTSFAGKTAQDLRAAIVSGQVAACSRDYTVPDLLAYLRFWLSPGLPVPLPLRDPAAPKRRAREAAMARRGRVA